MHLGFYFHVPAIKKNGGIYMPGYQGRFVDSLASYCDQVICFLHSPLDSELTFMDYRITRSNVTLVNIGPHVSVAKRILSPRKFSKSLRDYNNKLDLVLLRGPSPLLPAMAAASPVPVVFLLVSDYVAGVNDLPQPRWRKEVIRLWSYWNKKEQERAIRRGLTFVNSRALYDELVGKISYLEETRTTTLSKTDFFIRKDTCQNRPIRLLYAGRISVSKGLFDIFYALRKLLALGEDLILDIVGWPEKGEDNILSDLFSYARKEGFRDRVLYHGYKAVGPELFEYYKEADIFVLASRSSFEGFPRTIWEAMAHSLPVVATRVGSISEFIEDSAELVEPNNPEALANAILRLKSSPDLRQSHIQKGIALARNNTLEVQVREMFEKIQKWVSEPA